MFHAIVLFNERITFLLNKRTRSLELRVRLFTASINTNHQRKKFRSKELLFTI